MSRVSTAFGEVYAQTLREGDQVRTADGRFLVVRHIDRMTLDEDFLKYHPGALPVVIRRGALAPNLPTEDLTLAPYQKVHKRQKQPMLPMDRAIDALSRPQVFRRSETIITYTSFHCGEPATIISEGLLIDTAP